MLVLKFAIDESNVVAGGKSLKSFETIRTWLIVVGLLLFSGLASLAWVTLSGQETGLEAPSLGLDLAIDVGEPVTIQLDQYLLGEVLVDAPLISQLQGVQVPSLLLAAILTAITVGGLVAIGLPLALIYVRLERQTEEVKEDPEFQERQAALEKQETERLRALNEEKPPTPMPSHEMPRWAVASTALVILFFVIMISFTLGDTFYAGDSVQLGRNFFVDPGIVISLVLGLITLIGLAGTLGRRSTEGEQVEDEDREGIPWGVIWVALTGFIFLGVGIGIMLAIRGAGG